ncbi:linear amide C-N hydrolase [Aquabacter spiritensis]|uniref:Penicillin amidase n=1 Tax=Aquabacter spiritensis TaxID=933073 RepID=A0A4R3LYH6_9HYPH|nr:linear amide C-N hydrolase [Aquabacter spiritensis]TCT05702.1 penicillin amidase [Aquabacter spiritensis]
MCTALVYTDAAGGHYLGRTLELTIDLPYQIVYLPAGLAAVSQIQGHPSLHYTIAHAFLSVTMPARVPTPEAPIGLADLKVIEGLNAQGLAFSLLSYPRAGGTQQAVEATRAVLSVSDLGSWVLGQFATVDEVKTALAAQPVMLEALPILGGVSSPFHYVVNDASGASLVIEFDNGRMSLLDNPVRVMTNGPKFDWHLTNLDNYTFLSNVDKSNGTFGRYEARQPDSGIATAGLPSSSTSVGRFIRAVYYAAFTEKADSPDAAVHTLAHIMNNFDRPRGVSIDYPEGGGGHMEVQGLASDTAHPYATEFTCWTSLSDLGRKLFFVRDYGALNYTQFDLGALSTLHTPKVVPLASTRGAAPYGLRDPAPA